MDGDAKDAVIEDVGKLTVADLMASSCRWPSGDPRDLRTFRYCGEIAHEGPYCARHRQLAYAPDVGALRRALFRLEG